MASSYLSLAGSAAAAGAAGGRWTRSDPPDEDPDVLATHNPAFLNFVERKMYVAATEALHLHSEKILGRRTLSAEEKSMIKWRFWTTREVIGWWQRQN